MANIEINGRPVVAEEGEMLLAVLRRNGLKIPTLCNYDGLPPTGACRMCVVEVEDKPNLVPSCAFPVQEGMKIHTHSSRAVKARQTIIQLLLSNHPDDCNYCKRNGNCELQTLAHEHGVRERLYRGVRRETPLDMSSPSLVRDPEKCILCGKCVRACEEVQCVGAIDFSRRGSNAQISTAFDDGINLSTCINCGQCAMVCPTAAITERAYIKQVQAALQDPDTFVIVQHAPAVSVSLAEEFDVRPGVDVNGSMVAALRRLGFDRIFDTAFSADLTIMEEASELAHRIANGGVLPMMTSCSPGWIKYVEQSYPDMIPNLSTCKSPQQMMGALIKSYFAEKEGIDPSKIFSVSVMPCTAKKFEATRPEMVQDGVADIDAVLTTRELAQMIRMHGLDLMALPAESADSPLGERSSAGKIFGASGGVMEAAVRTAHYLLTEEELGELKLSDLRGLDGIKYGAVEIAGTEYRVAVASGLGNASKLIDEIRAGREEVHFLEVMTCPGGCINGGGQPIGHDADAVRSRMGALYAIDRDAATRVSHANQSVQRLYREYLGEPLGEKSHKLLHTHYHARHGGAE